MQSHICHVRTAYRRLPIGGKLSRKRLMRGDQSALVKSNNPHAPQSPIGREAVLCKALAPPNQPKNFPVRQPPHKKREKFIPTNRRLPCREVRGDEGGLEEEEIPFQGGSSPSKVFPCASKVFPLPLPPNISPYKGNGKEGERNQDCKNDDPDNENRHGNV